MATKWVYTKDGFSSTHATAKYHHLTLRCSDIDGEYQFFEITIKTAKGERSVFSCEPLYVGIKEAQERVVYIARSIFHGLPVKLTDWEKRHCKYGDTDNIAMKNTVSIIRGVHVNGIYQYTHSEAVECFKVKLITNLAKQVLSDGTVITGTTQVVYQNVYTDVAYSCSVNDFINNFKLVEQVPFKRGSK